MRNALNNLLIDANAADAIARRNLAFRLHFDRPRNIEDVAKAADKAHRDVGLLEAERYDWIEERCAEFEEVSA